MPLHDWCDDRGWSSLHLVWQNQLLDWVQVRLPLGYRAYLGSVPALAIGTPEGRPDLGVRRWMPEAVRPAQYRAGELCLGTGYRSRRRVRPRFATVAPRRLSRSARGRDRARFAPEQRPHRGPRSVSLALPGIPSTRRPLADRRFAPPPSGVFLRRCDPPESAVSPTGLPRTVRRELPGRRTRAGRNLAGPLASAVKNRRSLADDPARAERAKLDPDRLGTNVCPSGSTGLPDLTVPVPAFALPEPKLPRCARYKPFDSLREVADD